MHTGVLIGHVLGAGVIIGSTLIAILLVAGKALTPERVGLVRQLQVLTLYGLFIQFVTGVHMVLTTHWAQAKNSLVFWAKMGLFIVLVLLTHFVINRRLRGKDNVARQSLPGYIFLAGLIVVVIVALGVLMIEGYY